MKIIIAGPMSLDLINHPFDKSKLPLGYPFPPMSKLVNSFIKRGHKVIAVSHSTGIEKAIVLESENITLCIAKRRERRAARDFYKEEVKQLVKLYKEFIPEIIFTNWTYEFALAAIKAGTKYTIRIHDHAPTIFKIKPDAYRLMRLLINYYVWNKGKNFNANSNYIYQLLPNRVKKKTIVINNSFDSGILQYKWNKGKENFIVTVSDGFSKWKNIENGLISFSKIKKMNNNLRYTLIGSGMEPGGPAYKFAKNNGLLEGVDFLGRQTYSETLTIISKAIVMLHPSLEESFGMSVLESMVLGTCVVGGEKSGNIPSLLNFGKVGKLCNVLDPIDIASKVIELIKDEQQRLDFEKKAYEFANENYSNEIIIPQFEKLFTQIIG